MSGDIESAESPRPAVPPCLLNLHNHGRRRSLLPPPFLDAGLSVSFVLDGTKVLYCCPLPDYASALIMWTIGNGGDVYNLEMSFFVIRLAISPNNLQSFVKLHKT